VLTFRNDSDPQNRGRHCFGRSRTFVAQRLVHGRPTSVEPGQPLVNILGYKVGAMILHAVTITAFFVDQAAQAPVQIQCVQQSTPDSWLKQWIPTAVSLLSIGIGVWIAQWSFRASSKRDHEQWVLDQKKAEWAELLDAINDCQDALPRVDLLAGSAPVNESIIPAYKKVLRLQQILFNRLFIDKSTLEPIMSAWFDVSEKAKMAMGGHVIEYTVAYAVFVGKVRGAARKDLGIQGINYPVTGV